MTRCRRPPLPPCAGPRPPHGVAQAAFSAAAVGAGPGGCGGADFGLAAGQVVSQARQYDVTRTDAIVVLGASQYWGKPSPVLANRLDFAAQLYRDGVAPVILTVGGGIPETGPPKPRAGANYLQSLGVPATSVMAIPEGATRSPRWRPSLPAPTGKAGTVSPWCPTGPIWRAAQPFWTRWGSPPTRTDLAMGDGALLTPEYVARESMGLIRFQAWDRWQLATDPT